MKCPDTGTIQAYIDGELDIGIRKDLEIHIGDCEKCESNLKSLKENDDFAFGKLQYYKNNIAENHTNMAQYSGSDIMKKVTDSKKGATSPVLNSLKGVNVFMHRYKKYIAAACTVVVLSTCISIQPVRAVISDALSIFRVDEFKGLRITPQELAQIKENLSKGQGDFTLDKIGRITMSGGLKKTVPQAELASQCSFPVLFPDALADTNPEIQLAEPSTMSFTLNVNNVNTLLKTFKAKELLPDEIDGKTFSAAFGTQALIHCSLNDKTYEIVETTSPDMQVPEGVDADKLFNTLVNVPVIPDEMKSRLLSINDWKSTLYIPILQDAKVSIDEVKLNGNTAYVSSNEGKTDNNSDLRSSIVWMENGAIYAVSGNTGRDDLMQFAGNMK